MSERVERYENRLRDVLQDMVDGYEAAKQNFLEKFELSGSYAIQWNADDIVMAEELNKIASYIFADSKDKGLLQATKDRIERIQSSEMRFFNMSSSNIYSNANDYYVHQAHIKFVDRASTLVEYIEDAMAEVQEKQDLVDNVTDTTVYALQAQRNELKKQSDKLYLEEADAKSKRDQLAYNTARQAITVAITNLDKLAADLGVELS